MHGNMESDVGADMAITKSCKSVHSSDKWYRSSFKKLQSTIKNCDVCQ